MKVLLIVFVFCISAQGTVLGEDAPDLVILNAKIHTVASKKVRKGGIAIKDGRIIKVDHTYKIRNMMVRETKRVDARGRLVVPGFNDSHTHFMAIGNLFTSIDLSRVRDPGQIPSMLRHYVRFLPKGRWIQGGNWDSSNWNPEKLPTRHLIDAATPETPVLLYGPSAEIALANSKALELAGIAKGKKAPLGGKIEIDSEGEPTGVLRGTAILLVRGQIPRLASKQFDEVGETATNYAASLGVTSVQDMHSDYMAETLRELNRKGKLKTRVYDCTPLSQWKRLADRGIQRASGDGFVREGCLKSLAFSDRGATEDLYKNISAADRAGLQVMIHAIGSSANRNILNIYERVITENGKRDRRFRSEHAARLSAIEISRFGRLNIVPSLQPRLFGGYEPYRSLIESGAPIAFGSDATMTDFDPLAGVHYAVTRGRPSERLAVHEAVRLYTLGSAYAEFQEDEKGTIEKGKYADVVLLSENIFEIPKEEIRNVRVEMTIVNGEIVYDARQRR